MLGRTHMVFGAASAAVAIHAGLLPHDPRLMAVSAVFAILPDIDHPRSLVGRCLPFVSWPLSQIAPGVGPRGGRDHPGHRTVTHSLLALGLLMLLVAPLGRTFALAVGVGYASHLLGDVLTDRGLLHLLWPLRLQTITAGPLSFDGGGIVEHLVFGAAVLVAATGLF